MNKKISLNLFELIATPVTMLLGVFLHFTFKLSNYNILISIFSPVNESVWEHLKLIYFPILLTTIIGYYFYKDDYPNYLAIKTKSNILALLFIIIFFYTYSGILGQSIISIDIASFFIAIIISELYTFKYLKNNIISYNNTYYIIILIILFILFWLFTFFPLHIGLFKDPLTSLFGIIYH